MTAEAPDRLRQAPHPQRSASPSPAVAAAARLAPWLVFVSAVLLALWGALSLRAGGTGATLPMPSPFGAIPLRLQGLAAGAAVLAGILFCAAALGRAARVGAGSLGTVLLMELLLVCVGWFLAAGSPLGMLAGWEALSATTYFLMVRDRQRTRRAAWALLGLSEFGALLLFFALIVFTASGSAALTPGWAAAISLLALFAFGAKAGLLPLQVWVPVAEPEAPGDVAGLFSGLLTAVAVVGYLRVVQIAGPPLFGLGVVTAVSGLAGAGLSALLGIIERDAKRVLAYGTLEALGLVFTALGVAEVLQSQGAGSAAAMALGGAVVLLIGHAGGKFALFSLAGFLEERAGLRLLDRMGGIFRRQAHAAPPALLAAATLAGLPPFGAFLGEWLLIEACYVPTPGFPALHVALSVIAAVVATVSALGLTIYLRWLGIGFLGPARSRAASAVPDVPPLARAGQWLAALAGAGGGIAAGWILPWTAGATEGLVRGQAVIAATYVTPAAYAPIVALGAALFRGVAGSTGNVVFAAGGFDVGSPWDLALFAGLLGLAVALVAGRLRGRRPRLVRTWVGGEPDDAARLLWSSEGYSHPLRITFAAFFGLTRMRVGDAGPAGVSAIRYRASTQLLFERYLYAPLLLHSGRLSTAIRHRVQSGEVGIYLGYLLGAALVGLLAVAIAAR